MSKALPFLKCPEPLVNCDYAGNVGFDPLGMASSAEQLAEYREAEVKHARLAMLVRCNTLLPRRAVPSHYGLLTHCFTLVSYFPFLCRQAAVGWPLSELWDRQIASYLSLDPMLESGDRVPSLLNGGLDQVSPVWWGFCLGLTAAIDLYGLSKAREGNPSYFPGNLQFDPFGLYPSDKDGRERMETAEIKHGRLAMMAVVGYAVQEYVTKLGVVDETPYFF
jgi:Chlorophyll A-B binding protein